MTLTSYSRGEFEKSRNAVLCSTHCNIGQLNRIPLPSIPGFISLLNLLVGSVDGGSFKRKFQMFSSLTSVSAVRRGVARKNSKNYITTD